MVNQTDPTCLSDVIQHCWMQHVDPLGHLVGVVNKTEPTCSSNVIQQLLDATCGSVGTPCWMIVVNQTDPYVGPTSSIIVECNRFDPFEHLVG